MQVLINAPLKSKQMMCFKIIKLQSHLHGVYLLYTPNSLVFRGMFGNDDQNGEI